MQTLIRKIDKNSLNIAKEILLNGGNIGMPTETVYGLAGDGTNEKAVENIFAIKGRPSDNPLIAHVHKDYDLSTLVHIRHNYVYDLIKKYMPGPLTLVLESKGVVCEKAVCGGNTLAIRMPEHKGCRKLLKLVNVPIVAPSANLSKHTSPVTAQHVYNDLGGKIPLILDGGKCMGGIESTVLDVTGEVPRILRAGLITKEMIERIVGACEIAYHLDGDKVKSPGVKYKHYRPRCETALFSKQEIAKAEELYDRYVADGKKPFIMCDDKTAKLFKGKQILNLGKSGKEIASNLYEKLLEGENKADLIIALSFDREDGVFMGIMNRLRKSCG